MTDLVNTTTETPNATRPQAPKVLLQGEMGSGKTTAIRGLIECGIEVFLLSTEPGFQEVLGDIPSDKLHWAYVESLPPDFKGIEAAARALNTTSYDNIQKMGGIDKASHQQIFKLIALANDFVDERTGESFGDVGKWGPDRALVLDSLSGLNSIAKSTTIGNKPFLELRDYSAIQHLIENFVNTCATGTDAWFIMTAHLERETDPNSSRSELMVSTIGKALAPKIGRMFSDVIHCKMIIENGQPKWTWDTISNEARVKTRNLPLKQGMPADFRPLVANWKKKVGMV